MNPLGLNANEQRQLEDRLQKRQMQDAMNMFAEMFQTCFVSCVDEFTSKALSSRENGCIQRCVQKTFATKQRLGDRFQELSQTVMNPNQ